MCTPATVLTVSATETPSTTLEVVDIATLASCVVFRLAVFTIPNPKARHGAHRDNVVLKTDVRFQRGSIVERGAIELPQNSWLKLNSVSRYIFCIQLCLGRFKIKRSHRQAI